MHIYNEHYDSLLAEMSSLEGNISTSSMDQNSPGSFRAMALGGYNKWLGLLCIILGISTVTFALLWHFSAEEVYDCDCIP